MRRDVSALGKGSDAVLVEFLRAFKSSSLNRGREQSVFLNLGLHREPRSPMTSSNAVPAEAARLRLKPPICRKPQPVWVLQGLGRGAEMKCAPILRSSVLSFLCLPSPISLNMGCLCFPLPLKLVLCLCRRLRGQHGAPSPGPHPPGHGHQPPWVLECWGAGGTGNTGVLGVMGVLGCWG